jgi:hypothetical protein
METHTKMVMISYNEAVDVDVSDALECCGITNYTKVMGVFGCGNNSGKHFGNDVWPGRNNLLYIACDGEKAVKLMNAIRALRQKIGKEGAKAFLMPLQDLT